MKGKETICWDCKNYSRCSWSRGKPVKGWKATPTEFIDKLGNEKRIVRSFLVEDCPHFKAGARRVTIKEISQIIGKKERTIFRTIIRKGRGFLFDLLEEKGYKLRVYEELPNEQGQIEHTCYIEKI